MIFFSQKVDLSCDHNYKTITKSSYLCVSTLGMNKFNLLLCLSHRLSIYQSVFQMSVSLLSSFSFIFMFASYLSLFLNSLSHPHTLSLSLSLYLSILSMFVCLFVFQSAFVSVTLSLYVLIKCNKTEERQKSF